MVECTLRRPAQLRSGARSVLVLHFGRTASHPSPCYRSAATCWPSTTYTPPVLLLLPLLQILADNLWRLYPADPPEEEELEELARQEAALKAAAVSRSVGAGG